MEEEAWFLYAPVFVQCTEDPQLSKPRLSRSTCIWMNICWLCPPIMYTCMHGHKGVGMFCRSTCISKRPAKEEVVCCLIVWNLSKRGSFEHITNISIITELGSNPGRLVDGWYWVPTNKYLAFKKLRENCLVQTEDVWHTCTVGVNKKFTFRIRWTIV